MAFSISRLTMYAVFLGIKSALIFASNVASRPAKARLARTWMAQPCCKRTFAAVRRVERAESGFRRRSAHPFAAPLCADFESYVYLCLRATIPFFFPFQTTPALGFQGPGGGAGSGERRGPPQPVLARGEGGSIVTAAGQLPAASPTQRSAAPSHQPSPTSTRPPLRSASTPTERPDSTQAARPRFRAPEARRRSAHRTPHSAPPTSLGARRPVGGRASGRCTCCLPGRNCGPGPPGTDSARCAVSAFITSRTCDLWRCNEALLTANWFAMVRSD